MRVLNAWQAKTCVCVVPFLLHILLTVWPFTVHNNVPLLLVCYCFICLDLCLNWLSYYIHTSKSQHKLCTCMLILALLGSCVSDHLYFWIWLDCGLIGISTRFSCCGYKLMECLVAIASMSLKAKFAACVNRQTQSNSCCFELSAYVKRVWQAPLFLGVLFRHFIHTWGLIK